MKILLSNFWGKINNLSFPKVAFPEFTLFSKIHLSFTKKHKLSSFRISIIKLSFFLIGVATSSLIFSLIIFNQVVRNFPDPANLKYADIPTTSKIYDRNYNLLYEVYADENRTPVRLNEIPEYVKKATIAIEDKEFYRHKGLSVKGVIRAFFNNIKYETLEGGSTITQQLVRSIYLTPEKTISRKVKEIILSVWAESIYSKDQILEMYLNQVPYGGTAWGIEAASQTYFGKNVKELSLSEITLLAGLPAAPSKFSPFGARPELAKGRQKDVLNAMVSEGYISKSQAEDAYNNKLEFKTSKTAIYAPHFVMYVKQLLESYYGTKLVERGGLRVITSLDLNMQSDIQGIVSEQINNLSSLNVGNGAVLITDPTSGEILTMIGSKNYFDLENDGNVNITLSLRQPGSSIKAVTYTTALIHGYTAASIINDSPIRIEIPGQPDYKPVNYDRKFHGQVSLREALASSYNIPAVKILSSLGIEKMIEQGKKMGINSWEQKNDYGLSLTLGGAEVTMLDMSRVYGTLANKGIMTELKPILSVINHKGDNLPLPTQKRTKAVPESIAFIISDILADNRARTPAFGTRSSLYIPGKTIAVKTGTSDNKRDNWTIGYTPKYVVAVWVGNNDNTPMHPVLTSGVTGAAPIWNEIMTSLTFEKEDTPFNQPANVISTSCRGRLEYFVAGTQPKNDCAPIRRVSPKPSEQDKNN